jgi:hypothetical protein
MNRCISHHIQGLMVLFSLVFLFGCNQASKDPLVKAFPHSTGWLVCHLHADSLADKGVFTKDGPGSCPQLVLAKEHATDHSGSGWRLLSRNGLSGPFSSANLVWLFPSTLIGKTWSITDSFVVSLLPTRNTNVSYAVDVPGLIIQPSGLSDPESATIAADPPAIDTFPLTQIRLRPDALKPAASLSACLDSIAAAGVQGLVSGLSLPKGLCHFNLPSTRVAEDTHNSACEEVLSAGRGLNGRMDFAEIDCGSKPIWIVRGAANPEPSILEQIAAINDQLVGEPIAIAFMENALFIETSHHYPDGRVTQLQAITPSIEGWAMSQPLALSDASGEGEGGATQVNWWPAGSAKADSIGMVVCLTNKEQAPVGTQSITASVLSTDGEWTQLYSKAQIQSLCAQSQTPEI